MMDRARAAVSSVVFSADMPDVAIAAQTRLLMLAFGFGFLLGVAYDLFRIVRLTVTRGRVAVFVMDVAYFLSAGVLVFLFMLAHNQGELRFYMLLGIALGFLIYYFTFGAFVLKWSNRLVRFLRRFLKAVWRIVSAPFRMIGRFARRLYIKIRSAVPGKLKNFKVKSKINLKH